MVRRQLRLARLLLAAVTGIVAAIGTATGTPAATANTAGARTTTEIPG